MDGRERCLFEISFYESEIVLLHQMISMFEEEAQKVRCELAIIDTARASEMNS